MSTPNDYVTTEQVAWILSISMNRLKARVRAGAAPPCYKVGARTLWRLSEVEAWIDAHIVRPQATAIAAARKPAKSKPKAKAKPSKSKPAKPAKSKSKPAKSKPVA